VEVLERKGICKEQVLWASPS